MVKIVNGEIVEDHDPRARSLFQAPLSAPPSFPPSSYHLPPDADPTSYASPYPYPYQPHPYYSQYAYQHPQGPHYTHEYLHHSPFGYDEQPILASPPPPPPHLAQPQPPPSTSPFSSASAPPTSTAAPSASSLPAPSLSSRRLSLSSSSPLPLSASPAVSHRRLSFSSAPPSSLPHQPPPGPSSLYPRRSPSSYNLFGLPSLIISDIPVKPHVYLLAGLLLYFIGPPVLVPLLASFFFYRWHLNKEAEKKEKERLAAKFSAFRSAKTRPREQAKTIHSLRDIQG